MNAPRPARRRLRLFAAAYCLGLALIAALLLLPRLAGSRVAAAALELTPVSTPTSPPAFSPSPPALTSLATAPTAPESLSPLTVLPSDETRPTPQPADPRYLVRLRPVESWTAAERAAVQDAAARLAERLAQAGGQDDPNPAFLDLFGGPVEFRKTPLACPAFARQQLAREIDCAGAWGLAESPLLVWVFPGAKPSPAWAAHELGHAFSQALARRPENELPPEFLQRETGFAGGFGEWQLSRSLTCGEIFADLFASWVFGASAPSDPSRNNWFDVRLPDWLGVQP